MEEKMVIKFEPFREVVIKDCTRFKTPDDLARFSNIVAGGRPTGMYWAEGVVFIYFPLSTATEASTKSIIEEGRIYWVFVGYAFMPEYLTRIETKERLILPVIDMSTSDLFKKVARWLKDRRAD